MAGRFDYDRERQTFSWEKAAAAIPRLPAGGLNIAHVALDAQVDSGHGDDIALLCVDETGGTTRHTYADLAAATSRFAHLLGALGVGPGDRVMSLLGRQVEQYVTALGTLKNRSVFSPLFSSFGPEPIRQRLSSARPRSW
ncbi:AMP-binding protein [Nocardioides sp.]|uniref:AMP-binding protein n=1 Tax=Nocardioides sp. TaxID=35761 RepID=UPI003528E714